MLDEWHGITEAPTDTTVVDYREILATRLRPAFLHDQFAVLNADDRAITRLDEKIVTLSDIPVGSA